MSTVASNDQSGATSSSDSSSTYPVTVHRKYDDGYTVRSMTPADACIVRKWYCTMGATPRNDLDIVLGLYPPGSRGFYIGEYKGEVVASVVRLPWGDGVFYGSYYFVEEKYRRQGFGTRLRDEVAFEHVGKGTLVVDAVKGKVAETNKKLGYKEVSRTERLQTVAKGSYELDQFDGSIVPGSEVSFEKIISYDNRCFITKDYPPRREFLRRWIDIPLGAAYVAVDHNGNVTGFACRRPCIQAGTHQVGPVYADSRAIAEALVARLCSEVTGDRIVINIWQRNEEAVAMVNKFGFETVFYLIRMYVNGDPNDFKKEVYAVTSIDICGF